MTDTTPAKPAPQPHALAAFATPGPLGAILLAACAIIGMLAGAEKASAIAAILFIWLIVWGVGRAMSD